MEKFKKYAWSFTIFLMNIMLMLLGYHTIKANDKNTLAIGQDSQTQIKPLSQAIVDAQNQIVNDRENKLRNLNNSPKQIKQNQVTTQTTTTTPDPVSTSSSSSSSTKSSTKTKTS